MNILQIAVLLFLLGSAESAGKLERILKKVGKRWYSWSGGLMGSDSDGSDLLLTWHLREQEWNQWSDEEIASLRREQMETMGKWFGRQLGDGFVERWWARRLINNLFTSSITLKLCGSDTVLDYYKAIKYMDQSRKGYVGWENSALAEYKYNLEETDRKYLNFTVMFKVKSKLGSVVNMGYRITSTLNLEKKDKWCDYDVLTVEILGDCQDLGSVQGDLLSQQELWKQDTDVQKVLRMFNRDYEVTPLHPKQLPRGWLKALEPSEKFSAMTCNLKHTSNSLTVEQFKKWYDRLDIMWHPNGTLTAQILNLKANEEVEARITMPLQLGWNDSNPIHDWEFKIKAVYNTRGDNQWYITTVLALCPQEINIVEEYLAVIPKIISLHFSARVVDNTQWFSAIEFLPTFKNETITLLICDEADKFEQMDTIPQLEERMWWHENWHKGKFERYELEQSEKAINPPQYPTWFKMHLYFTEAGTARLSYKTTWKFNLAYNDDEMFFHVLKAEFGCMIATDDFNP